MSLGDDIAAQELECIDLDDDDEPIAPLRERYLAALDDKREHE